MTAKYGIVFPGQGSQSVGMMNALNDAYAIVGQTFEEASDALKRDLWRMAYEGPESDLNQTENTQPVMLAAGVAVWRILQQQNVSAPLAMAGHSFGEYSALVAAGAIEFSDGIKLVAKRGRYMQSAVPDGSGAMAALLGLDDDQVRGVCERAAEGEVIEPVNFNSPGQVVVAGHAPAVDRALKIAKETGAKRAIKLSVSVPSHCRLMKPAAERLAAELATVEITSPAVSVIHNADVSVATDADGIRRRLTEQLSSPVLWADTVRKIAGQGASALIEAGPGKVLAGLAKRIDRSLQAVSVNDPASLDKALEVINA